MAAPSATSTRQKGVAVIIETRPQFTGYINTDFPEQQKAREQSAVEGEFGQNVTELFNDLTSEVSAKLVVSTGTVGTIVAPQIGDVLAETAIDVNTGNALRKWLVMEVGRPRKAGKEMLFDLKLKISEGVSLT